MRTRMVRTSNAIWVDEADRYQVVLGVEVTPIRDAERLVGHSVLDGTPDVDDTNAAFQQTFSILAKVTVHSRDTGVECLVDMDAFLQTQR